MEKTRYPRFLGQPCVHAPLSDPGGPPTAGHYRSGDVAFRPVNNIDSAMGAYEAQSRGLHDLCVRFAAGVAPGLRHTRFRLVASLDRSGLSPAGSHSEVSVMSIPLHGFLLHQASLGAITDHESARGRRGDYGLTFRAARYSLRSEAPMPSQARMHTLLTRTPGSCPVPLERARSRRSRIARHAR